MRSPFSTPPAGGVAPALQHVVVVCDGTPRGDAAARLADSIAAATGASVRATTILALPGPVASWPNDPVIATLEAANQQLFRVTREPGLWRLTLLTGRWPERLLAVCGEEHADLVVLPAQACEAADPITRACDAVVACVDDAGDAVEGRLQLTTPPDESGDRRARLVAAVAGGLGYVVGSLERRDARGTTAPPDATTLSDRTAPA